MSNLGRRNAVFPWLVGAFLAISLTLVAPHSRIHHFAASLKTAHAHHLASRRTLVDQGESRPDASIDRAGHTALRGVIVIVAPTLLAVVTLSPNLLSICLPLRLLKRLRVARDRADGEGSHLLANFRV